MSLFKKKKKTEVITFSVEDARAMVEGRYNEALEEIRLDFWTNVKKMQWREKQVIKTMSTSMTIPAARMVSVRML